MNVEVSTRQVTITNQAVTDVEVVAAFNAALEAGKDPDEFLNSVLSLGAQVVALGSHTTSAEKIDARVDQAKSAIKEVAENFEDTIQKKGAVGL